MNYKISIELTDKQVKLVSRLLNAVCGLYLGQWPEAFRMIYPRGQNLDPLPADLKALMTVIDWKKYQKGVPRISINDDRLTDEVRMAFDIVQVLRSTDRKLLPTSRNKGVPRIPVQFSTHFLPKVTVLSKSAPEESESNEDES